MNGRPPDVEHLQVGSFQGEVFDTGVIEADVFGELAVVEDGISDDSILKIRFLVEIGSLKVCGFYKLRLIEFCILVGTIY